MNILSHINCWLCIFHMNIASTLCSNQNIRDVYLNFSQVVQKYGYSFNEYQIVTEDGYILALHRVNSKLKTNKKKEPVLMGHGLLTSSECWIFLGPKKALAYLLADANYDVWLANARGSMHSRKHKTLNPDQDIDFWKFSWHEIGMYDLPAHIDFILKTTKFKKLHYIGHSQGTTQFFVMASQLPEYTAKIQFMVALSPSTFLVNINQPLLKIVSPFYLIVDDLATSLRQLEFVPFLSQESLRSTTRNLCDGSILPVSICKIIVKFLIAGIDWNQFDEAIAPYVASTFPSGASTRQFLHYAQNIANRDFRLYDFGSTENLKRYNSSTPPKYPLKNIRTPVALFFGDNDEVNSEKDVKILANILPNVVELYRVPFKKFSHNDFVWAKDVKTLVYDEVFRLLKNYSMT